MPQDEASETLKTILLELNTQLAAAVYLLISIGQGGWLVLVLELGMELVFYHRLLSYYLA